VPKQPLKPKFRKERLRLLEKSLGHRRIQTVRTLKSFSVNALTLDLDIDSMLQSGAGGPPGQYNPRPGASVPPGQYNTRPSVSSPTGQYNTIPRENPGTNWSMGSLVSLPRFSISLF